MSVLTLSAVAGAVAGALDGRVGALRRGLLGCAAMTDTHAAAGAAIDAT